MADEFANGADMAALEARYSVTSFGPNVLHTDLTGSTQDDMAELWRASDLPAYTALVADAQTAGRGRVGRMWYSAPERSLTVSVLVELPQSLQDSLGWLTLIGGAAARASFAALTSPSAESASVSARLTSDMTAAARIADPILTSAPSSTELALSWPNDVVVVHHDEQRKIAGILGEYLGTRAGKVTAVLGMGANLSLTAEELPTPTSASLATTGLTVPPREAVVAQWLANLITRVDAFVAADGDPAASGILAEVNRECATLRPGITVGRPRHTPVYGTGKEILEDGSLVVATDQGDVVVTSGEVSLFGMTSPQSQAQVHENSENV